MFKGISATASNHSLLTDSDGDRSIDYFVWGAVGLGPYHIPRAIPRDGGDDDPLVTEVTTLTAAFGDQWIDPRSGGLIGAQIVQGIPGLVEPLPMTDRHFRRTIAKDPVIRKIGRLRATNVATRASLLREHKIEAAHSWVANLGLIVTNTSGGSGPR
jgi:hypothetical protein